MRFAFIIFIFTFVFSRAFAQEPALQDINAAVKRLGAETFEEREQASEYLWIQGVAAHDVLQAALKSKDPEVSMRAREILKKINAGIFPDTPKNLVGKLKKYNSLDNNGKSSVLSYMAEMGDEGWKSLLFLIKREIADENANLRPINKFPKKKALLRRLIEESGGWDDLSESLLKAGVLGDSGFDDYLAWIICKGTLEQRIDEFEKRVKGPRGKQYRKMLAFMYRAAGRLKDAQKTAEKAGVKWLALRAAMEAGDFKDSLRIYKSLRRERNDVETLGWIATLQHLNGQEQEFNKTIEELIQVVDKENDSYWYVAKVMMINELIPQVIDFARKHRSKKGDVLAFKGRPGEYLEANEKVRNEKDKTSLSYIKFLFLHGEAEKARELFKEISNKALEGGSPRQLPGLIAFADFIKDKSFDALLNAALESNEFEPIKLARKIYGSTAGWWWHYYTLKYPEEDTMKYFKRLAGSIKKTFNKQDFINHLDEVEKLFDKLPPKQQTTLRTLLVELNEKAGRSKLVLEGKIKIVKLNGNMKNMLAVGDWYAENDNWTKAAEWYEKTVQDYPKKNLPLYLWGDALCKSGHKEKGKKKIHMASLLPLGNPEERYALANGLRQRGLYDAAYREFQLIRLTEYYYNSWYLLESYKAISGIDQIQSRKLLQAGNYIGVAMFACLSTNISFLSHEPYLWYAYKKHLLRAKGLMALKQFKEAAYEYQSAFELAHEAVDESIKAIEEFEKNNRPEDAEAIYQKHKELLLADLKLLPKSSQLCNSLAWFMACNSRDLEEALKLANKAVKSQSKNAAYLDTLAETYFRLENREKAVEWQKKAVEYSAA